MVAIVAMSRMSKNTRDSQSLRKGGCNIQCLGMEYQYALKQYSKALKGVRESIARDEHDLRTSLITCLLVFCFETLQGRERPARTLALSGLALFHQSGNGSNVVPAVSLSSSCLLEEELLSAFASLDIQILCFYDGRSLTEHQDIIDDATKALEAMPSTFTSLEEANFFWQIMIRRNLHLKAKAEAEVNPADSRTKLESIAKTADTPASQLHFSILKEHSAEIQNECRRYILDIHKWTKATSEVFKSVRGPITTGLSLPLCYKSMPKRASSLLQV